MRFLPVLLITILSGLSTSAQWMHIGESQADFRRLVSAAKNVNGKLVSTGLERSQASMDSLIGVLKTEYQAELKKKHPSDSMILVWLERLSFCYQQQSWKNRNKIDSSIYYLQLKLVQSRKTREGEMASRSFDGIWIEYNRTDKSVPEKIALLKNWIVDYDSWIKYTTTIEHRRSPYLILANFYKTIRNDEEAEKTMLGLSKNSRQVEDRWMANQWLAEHYMDNGKKAEGISYYNEVVNNHPEPLSFTFASSILFAYKNMINYYIDENNLERADSLLAFYEELKICAECFRKFPAVSIAYANQRKALQARLFLARNKPDDAFPLLKDASAYNDSTRSMGNIDFPKYWYLYYKQKGDTSNALRSLEILERNQRLNTKRNDSIQKVAGNQQFALVRAFETQLLRDQADKEKQLQEQKLIAVQREADIGKLEAEVKNRELQNRATNSELQQKIEAERFQAEAKKNELQQFRINILDKDLKTQRQTRLLLLGGLGLFVIFAAILFIQNRQKQKVNRQLNVQKMEISQQKDQLEQTLTELNDTQKQLIQKEKMASLGELTAGIAHEIQNPLNFVNNFSELNTELIGEIREAIKTGDSNELNAIASDLEQNLNKITLHGKRADAIVKSMLLHSRNNSGQKVPTDINALADEYLRLSFHGMRAKATQDSAKKNFHSEIKTKLDPDLGKFSVVPQDIGRVFLNLFNNAFYAVAEKGSKDPEYNPEVILTTKALPHGVVITVKDNGDGIPAKLIEKVFQPFFTTKPTGQGTGLGLSLSYDIVRAHNGEIKLSSEPGKGTEFIVTLPAD